MVSYADSFNITLLSHNTNCQILGEFWPLRPVQQNNYMYPLEFGLMVYMEEQWKNIAWIFLDCALPAIPNFNTSRGTKSPLMDRIMKDKVFDPDEKRETARSVHVLFSSAGTGKTRQIFELLQKHWGFYLLAPNLDPVPESSESDADNYGSIDIIDTKRYSASRETYTMFEDHPQMIPEWVSKDANVFQPLIVARVALLYEFLRRFPSPTPTQWLWLQISCDAYDPFDALYRLFRLSSSEYLWFDDCVYVWAEIPALIIPRCYGFLNEHPDHFFNGSLYHCFDEAQLTLNNPQASSMLSHLYATLTLMYVQTGDWARRGGGSIEEQSDEHMEDQESDTRSWQISDELPYINPTLIISGTSLRLQVLEEKLATYSTYAWGEGEQTVTKWDSYRIHDSFPLIASDADFWGLYEQHLTGIIGEWRTSQGLKETGSWSVLPLLSRSGRPLAFESSKINLDILQAWLWKPLEVPTMTELLALMIQAYKLMATRNHSTDTSQIHLEQLLDHQDSEAVASVVTLGLIQLFKTNTAP
jgi:hypothetical protein